ncbi:PLP-dependent aminotransferase family protein [Corynebacterium breve]|uniref:PLP-dependent aminotransferase family protein n=1 Tax=Corynebacterium breve TaxID=3049799 RepID=A0ABY8VJ17_9CORY|nr:PLP-dependent aminotransferase family protein [Corynebacterium breve]WIM68194.1 PLP-dependent aminotransferase family protein [Corynebacterium breve]
MTLPLRIAAEIRTAVAKGALLPGDPVESTRQAARRLGCSRGTVVNAYEQLIAEGYLVAEAGSGTRINPELTTLHPTPSSLPESKPIEPSALTELTPGRPDVSGIITPEWRAAWREAASHPPTPTDPLGSMPFRREIANHLRLMRGLIVDPARVVVTAGAREGLALFLRALRISSVGVETPGYPSLRRVPEVLGCNVVEVPVDESGVTAPRSSLEALLVTPSHQYPLGGSMPAARRTELVAWARDNDAWLIEDDFDSELRYVGHPLPALAALAPEKTVLLGTFSSVISPALACGYLVVPEQTLPSVAQIRAILGQPASAITQEALAQFLASGALRRHTGRMRKAYQRRRDVLTGALDDCPNLQLVPVVGGLHAVIRCLDVDASDVVARCAAQGIGITALQDYWAGVGADNGLVLGFGQLDDEHLRFALDVLIQAASASPRLSSGT